MKDSIIGFWKNHWLAVVLVIAAFLLGFFAAYHFWVKPLQTELADAKAEIAWYKDALSEPAGEVGKVEAKTQVQTEIQYVPKEVIRYIDSSGNTVEALEKTDVQMDVGAPTVTMKYNGKEYEMPGISGETSKFEKGKLVGNVSTQTTLDVTDLVNKQAAEKAAAEAKHFAAGAYATNHGVIGSIGYINKNTEIGVITKVTDPTEFWGVGWRRYF